MSKLDKQKFFVPFRKVLTEQFGEAECFEIWSDAGKIYDRFLAEQPDLRKHKGNMVIPAAALFTALENHGKEAEVLLNRFGDLMGERFAGYVKKITSIPGMDKFLWKNIDKIMHKMSSPQLGYERRIVSEPPYMFGVDIISCPYHELSKKLGKEKAVLCICHMDKAYMQGFRHIRYERTTAVSEGAPCCDYRLRYDPEKE